MGDMQQAIARAMELQGQQVRLAPEDEALFNTDLSYLDTPEAIAERDACLAAVQAGQSPPGAITLGAGLAAFKAGQSPPGFTAANPVQAYQYPSVAQATYAAPATASVA